MSIEDVKTILHTFQAAFPHVSVWMPMQGDLILIGSDKPHELNYLRMKEVFSRPDISNDLARIGMETPPKFFRKFLMGGARLANYTAGARLNTDDRPLIEFNAPRNLYAVTSHTNQVSIVQHLGGAEVWPCRSSGWLQRHPTD
jgi:spermidine synthase